ncbi:putative pectate lyase F [Hypsizygus marmoreus]|uniref:Pectate lyase n=1 Tax=Hypsizygus marmoreus TaxID=39966 RepID=A0A369K788_HYPMA|nr:putative pectate lyase F [Hypsizygus marmoreus]
MRLDAKEVIQAIAALLGGSFCRIAGRLAALPARLWIMTLGQVLVLPVQKTRSSPLEIQAQYLLHPKPDDFENGVALTSLTVFATAAMVIACNAYNKGLPTPTGTVVLSSVMTIAAGQTFDCGWKKYERASVFCNDQAEGDYKDAVFYLQAGASLNNCIIGKNQAEGVHCNGNCYLNFIWFEDVCEDAITIKNDKAGQESWIVGGGAYKAGDKIVQHNGCGTVNIINFYANDYGKLYRSCGNCSSQCKRNVYIEGVEARNGGELAGINLNYGDTATIKDACYDTAHPCVFYNGCAGGCEPTKAGYCSG